MPLAAALDTEQLDLPLCRYLSYTLNSSLIRRQDATSTIISIASNVAGQGLAWDFVRSNWKKLFEE